MNKFYKKKIKKSIHIYIFNSYIIIYGWLYMKMKKIDFKKTKDNITNSLKDVENFLHCAKKINKGTKLYKL